MNAGPQSPLGKQCSLQWEWLDLGVSFRKEFMCLDAVCTGKNSNITLAALSFILILPEILLSAQEWDSLENKSILLLLLSEAQAIHIGAGRNGAW